MPSLAKLPKNFLQTFNKNGYLVVPEFLNNKEIKSLTDESDRLVDKYVANKQLFNYPFDEFGPFHNNYNCDDYVILWDKRVKSTTKYHNIGYIGNKLHINSDAVKNYAFSPEVKTLLKQFGYSKSGCYSGAYHCKVPGGNELVPHQDEFFFKFSTLGVLLNFWCALDRTTEENGCLLIYPESHKIPFDPKSEDVANRHVSYIDLPIEKFKKVPVEKGSLVVIHGLCAHSSGKNPTNDLRRAISVSFVKEEAQQTATVISDKYFFKRVEVD